jgi:predicted phosphodiesterase
MASRAQRVAALYDIHGNLPALEAVLRDVRAAGVDQVVVGGDVIPGPMSCEALEVLYALDLPVSFIQGNGEREVMARLAGIETGAVPERFREVIRWVGEQLPEPHRQRLMGWPATCSLDIEGLGQVLFCHATPRDDNEIFTRLTPESRLLPVFEPVGARVVVCGHTHMQFDRAVGATRVVNAGSVGMPFGHPGAYWLTLGPDLELCRTAYDLEAAAERVRATEYPQAQEFAATNILQPPAEAGMLEVFEQAALR